MEETQSPYESGRTATLLSQDVRAYRPRTPFIAIYRTLVLDITQDQLAHRIGDVTTATVQAWENNRQLVDASHVEALAEALELRVWQVVWCDDAARLRGEYMWRKWLAAHGYTINEKGQQP